MRIGFADFTGWDYHVASVETAPLGGSQSASCYLARAMARQGHQVLFVSSVSAPGNYLGVECRSWSRVGPEQIQAFDLDVLVCLLIAGNGRQLKAALGPRTRLILWTQHAHDQPGVQGLQDAAERASFDGFVFVSDWQRQKFIGTFGVEAARSIVLRNAIAPAFADLFPVSAPILPQKVWPPIVAYTSTPFRGLEWLLDVFPEIRRRVGGTRLRVFSSMQVYKLESQQEQAAYGTLYERCRLTDGVEYIGSLPQPRLASQLRDVWALAYPNTFAETSCIAVMEAMAAGCRIITTDLAALPETTAGFARLIPAGGHEAYLRQFADQIVEVLSEAAAGPGEAEAFLRRQVDHVNRECNWDLRARQWVQWLQ